MEFNLSILKGQIENLRSVLYDLICTHDLTNDAVVICSQELDKLLLEYEKAKLLCMAENITIGMAKSLSKRIAKTA